MAYILKISIEGSRKPIIWRRVKVNNNITFETLHYIIQTLFNWDNAHLYQFYRFPKNEPRLFIKTEKDMEFGREMGFVGDEDEDDNFDPNDPMSVFLHSRRDIYKLVNKTLLSDILKKEKDYIIYEYDFGDSWEHKIVLEAIDDETLIYPICIKGKGKTSPEDCGGIWGYQAMIEVLKAGKPKTEVKNYKEWLSFCGYSFPWDENEFDINAINETLIIDAQNNYEDFQLDFQ